MPLHELILLVPCHGAEDFPLDVRGDDAESLRASWSALWHPALVHGAGAPPRMRSVYDLPQDARDRVVIVPKLCHDSLPSDWIENSRTAGGIVIDGRTDRLAMSAEALAAAGIDGAQLDTELVADFYALGYAQLHVEVITHRLYYASELHDTAFSEHLLAAASHAVAGEAAAAREKLTACFDALAEARDHFHPLDAHLLDVVLVASTTLGKSLCDEISTSDGTPINLLIAPELIETLAAESPTTLELLRRAIEREHACLIGGVAENQQLPLMSPEEILAHLVWSLAVYQKHLGTRPRVFGCRRFAMTGVLPQILKQLGFHGVWHVALDGVRTPQTGQSKVRWQGFDGTAIDAVLQMPLDAANAAGYLRYIENVSQHMGMDYVATQVFARWPGQASHWHEDLCRASRFSAVLGRFSTFDAYFAGTDVPGELTLFEPDEYRTDYLATSEDGGDTNPISRVAERQLAHVAAQHAQQLEALAVLQAESSTAEVVPRTGLMIANTTSRVETSLVDVSPLARLPAVDDTVIAAAEQSGRKFAAVRVPPLGRARIAASDSRMARTGKLLAEERTLRNEFMEVIIGEHTGAIEKIHDYRTRGNRLSQQLAFRFAQPQQPGGGASQFGAEAAHYSVMAADATAITENGEVFAEITSRGRLLDLEGRVLARFVQKFQLWRGSRILHVDVLLEPLHAPDAGAWASYYALRFASPDDTADVRRSVNMAAFVTNARRIESPWFVEICTPHWRTGIFSGGTPFYRRVGTRKLDALLSVRGETRHHFRFGIGIDEPRPLPAALSVLGASTDKQPPFTSAARCAMKSHATAIESLIQVEPKNVIVTHLEPLIEQDRACGCRVRLLEVEGRGGLTWIRFARAIANATRESLGGETLGIVEHADQRISLEMSGHEWVQLEVRFLP